MNKYKVSIVIPAKNEIQGLKKILPDIMKLYPDYEVIVVDDGSHDGTKEFCEENSVTVVQHSYSKGNGASIKSGVRKANSDIIVFMDADGQHDPKDISRLLDELEKGNDMVVGARSATSQASLARSIANYIYNKFAEFMVNNRVDDLTSGFRAVKADKFREFKHLYPNGFSYPATSTMAFFRTGYSVAYIPIVADKRIGTSHIRIVKDGIRFILILFKIGTLYSPLKVFFPVSAFFFATGFSYFIYTYFLMGRFTNMTAMLFIISILIFLIGLVSEQVTMLFYQRSNDK